MSMPSFPVETIAKLFNLTPRRIQQLAKEKIIPKADRGKYDLVGSVQGYIRYLQDTTEGKKETADVKHERGRLLKAQADKTELEVETMKASLIPVEEVEMEWSALVTIFRSRLLAIPSRGAVLALSSKEVHVIENIL
jgi:phage terminase Nu1 subunit (DNA packaging protein)